ncbi:MAG: hypothetical protein WD077_08905 [Bacteroidia bacterium]
MSLQEKDIEIIDAYLEGRLCAEERFYIEEKIAYDAEFATEVREYRAVVNGIKELSRVHTVTGGPPLRHQNAGSPKRNQLFSLIAKSAIVLLVFSIPIILLLTRTTGTEAIFNRHFNPYLPEVKHEDPEDQKSFKAKGMDNYTRGNFEQASLYFDAHLLDNPDDDQTALLNGISYLATYKSSKSEILLQPLTQDPDSSFRADAFFFLGLASLQRNELPQARDVFAHLSAMESHYKDQAALILKEIEIVMQQQKIKE